MMVVENNSNNLYRDLFIKCSLSAKSKLLLLYILLRDEREFNFSPTRVSLRLGCSREQVKSSLKELEKKGLLIRTRKNPFKLRYLYQVKFPADQVKK